MSTENDVPLGEDSRRYYEQQFDKRIDQIKKDGSAPKRNNGGGSNWNGRAGCGGLLAVFFIIRVIAALVGTHSRTPSYDYTPPTPPRFDFELPNQEGKFGVKEDNNMGQVQDELRRLQQLLRENGQKNEADLLIPDGESLLGEADVPLLEGLCYRIQQESRQPQPTPGKRLYQRLPPPAQRLLVKAACGEKLTDNERQQLFEALEGLLQDEALYDAPSFENVPGMALMLVLSGVGDNPVKGTPRFNRLLLEKCYPRQIVPLDVRRPLDANEQAKWTQEARVDLNKARQEFE